MKTGKDFYIEEAKRSLSEAITALERVKNNLNPGFAKAVEILAGSRKAIVSGIGKSGLIARKIAATLTSVGVPAVFMHPVEALHGDVGLAEPGDCAILLSKSGATFEVVRLIPFLKSRGVKIIGISGSGNSRLTEESDVTLDASVEKESCPFDMAPTTSALAALALGDALAIAAMSRKNFTVEDFSRNHPKGRLGKNATLRVRDVMKKGDALPIVSPEALFHEAMVVMTEKTLGCVCVCDESGSLRGIITDGDVRRIFGRGGETKSLKVSEIMTTSPITVTPEASLGEALALMENRPSQIGALAVVDSAHKCVGVVRIHDILKDDVG